MKLVLRTFTVALALAVGSAAFAAVPVTVGGNIQAVPIAPLPASGVFQAFPAQNPQAPVGKAYQTNYPYPGQCVTPTNASAFPLLQQAGKLCSATGSFATSPSQLSQRTAGPWSDGGLTLFSPLAPILANSVPLAGITATPKFVWPVLNPPDYKPEAKFTGADYYEIGLHEAWGFQGIANAGLFPNPPGKNVPNGMQWTGLLCNATTPLGVKTDCSCPADAGAAFKATFCTAPGGKIAHGSPLFTPIWGVGQINNGGGPVTFVLSLLGLFNPATQPASAWSANQYVATWPSISIRANKGTPVVVKWTNEFPNNHVLCPHPEAADWPCAIDRTFMGVKARVDPGLNTGVVPDGVNQYGSPQQPDNSWVTHLHGGEIPPSTDGFAEKWFGNKVTGPLYTNRFVNPPFENPINKTLQRPALGTDKNYDVYTYPMVQEEATIWFHDHTLGKTHHNVIAGPAGFFPVREPLKHGGLGGYTGCPPSAPAGSTCTTEYTWLDPITEPRNDLGVPLYDLFLAVQDRSFNDDGSLNFSNALGQALPNPLPGGAGVLPPGYSDITPGVNPLVHPVWVPEYFGDHVLVNGVLWPKYAAVPGWYRLRIVDGSDSRCYTSGFSTALPAPGAKPTNNVSFYVIANDQGYLKNPVLTTQFTMCPGERYELLVNFGPANAAGVGVPAATPSVYLTNSAPAPFPAGITPYANLSPFAEMNVVMRFDINAANANQPLDVSALLNPPQPKGSVVLQLGGPPVKTCATTTTWNPAWGPAGGPLGTAPAADRTAMFAAITGGTACITANPALAFGANGDPGYNARDLRPAVWPLPVGTAGIIRQVYMNEKHDGTTLQPLGMQLNGVPFEYKVTETPLKNSVEFWQFVNLTVDAHPMHPHLVQHQLVARQAFTIGKYLTALCGSTTCQPGPSPGGEMQVVPDVTPMLSGGATPVLATSVEGGFKDASQVPPGMVTTIVAKWGSRWDQPLPAGAGKGLAVPPALPSAPSVLNTDVSVAGNLLGCTPLAAGCDATLWTYEDVTEGPYVWHCHINSHEDSEMMRTSMVVK